MNKHSNIRYLKLVSHVRYWEDTAINGVDDIELDDRMVASDKFMPRMPFVIRCTDRYFNTPVLKWAPTIDLVDGRIVDWPQGMTAQVHYKTCDENMFTFLDAKGDVVLDGFEGYVPSFLGEYGDYLVFYVDENGFIKQYANDSYDIEQAHDLVCTDDDIDEIISNAF